jgi:anti-sigma B factor antagonist
VSEFEVAIENGPDAIVLSPSGELDMGSAPVLEEALLRTEADPGASGSLVVDLRGLGFIDSSGLRVLLKAQERANRSGRKLTLVRGPIEVQRVFTIALPDGRLSFVDAPEDAWA